VIAGDQPWDPPLMTKGEWDVEVALKYLRAGLHEPMPVVTAEDGFARLYASALADYGLVNEENRRQVGEALILMGSQLAAHLRQSPGLPGGALLNMLSLAGMHVYEEGELRQCGHEWQDAFRNHQCTATRDHEPAGHRCMCGATL
jgi:hypothetical protein